jgi:hypothetical protein
VILEIKLTELNIDDFVSDIEANLRKIEIFLVKKKVIQEEEANK